MLNRNSSIGSPLKGSIGRLHRILLILCLPDLGQILDFCIIWELGGQERVQNTLTGCGIIFHYRGLNSEDFDFLTFWDFPDRLPYSNLSKKRSSFNAFISKPHPSRKVRRHKTLLGSTPSHPVSSTRHQIIKKMLTQKVLKIVLVSRCQPKGHGSRPGLVQSQVAKNLGLGVRVATRFAQSRSQLILGG